jgi:hypothetical protein
MRTIIVLKRRKGKPNGKLLGCVALVAHRMYGSDQIFDS